MEQKNNNSDKTEFKVNFLGEYHDIVIDWNDDKYICKGKQLFEKLESITGVPREFNRGIQLKETTEDIRRTFSYLISNFRDSDYPSKEMICDSIRDAGGRFHLTFGAGYEFTQTYIFYLLTPESWVPEGECSSYFCRYKHTKTFFNKLKDIITNDKLNSKIASAIQASRDPGYDHILRQFDVLKYLGSTCDFLDRRRSEELRRIFCKRNLYLRTQG